MLAVDIVLARKAAHPLLKQPEYYKPYHRLIPAAVTLVMAHYTVCAVSKFASSIGPTPSVHDKLVKGTMAKKSKVVIYEKPT